MKSLLSRAILFVLFICSVQMQLAIAADPDKVLRYVFPAAESGFDPAMTQDLYSGHIDQSVFETLYTYDYLARPVKLTPLTAEAMPDITDGGKTYTIRLKKGIVFAADPAFNGKRRELTMADYIYSFQRLLDPKVRSPHAWLFQGKVTNFELVDRYTLRIHLQQPDYNMVYILAHHPTSAVAREVVEKYQDAQGHVFANPVGTGPYRLTQWVRASRIVLEANPDYRDTTWDFQPSSDPQDQQIVAKMKGKKLPQIGRIEISVMTEDQSRWLSFLNDQTDLFQLNGPLAPKALTNGKLKPELVQKGVQLSRINDPELTYYYWNMRDPVVGGLSKEKIALRRAMAMAYNVPEEISIVWNNEATALSYPIPPGMIGHDPHYTSSIQYDPVAANALLDKFGYKKGRDGWRTLPDGNPLQVTYSARADSTGQLQAEVWKKALNAIGIKMVGDLRPFPDLLRAEKLCQLQMRTLAWGADYPDGDNFMQLFYGQNIGQNNHGCNQIPEYDTLYAQTQQMPPGPERDALYHKMARILEVYAPQRLGLSRYRNMLAQPRVIGYKKHPILPAEWMYFDIEKRK
ncbi:MAG: ABC transporter substrate-binding protein [Burkholderiaceae bacterium]